MARPVRFSIDAPLQIGRRLRKHFIIKSIPKALVDRYGLRDEEPVALKVRFGNGTLVLNDRRLTSGCELRLLTHEANEIEAFAASNPTSTIRYEVVVGRPEPSPWCREDR